MEKILLTYCLDENELIDILKGRLPQKDISEIINHERAHINRGVELGYHFSHYLLFIKKQKNNSCELITTVQFEEQVIKPKDMVEILLAPEKPSKYDIQNAKEY